MRTIHTVGMFKVIYKRTAINSLKRQPTKLRARVMAVIRAIAEDPFAAKNTRAPLEGAKDMFRQRLGDWRLIFRVDRKAGTITVLDFAPRGKAYK